MQPAATPSLRRCWAALTPCRNSKFHSSANYRSDCTRPSAIRCKVIRPSTNACTLVSIAARYASPSRLPSALLRSAAVACPACSWSPRSLRPRGDIQEMVQVLPEVAVQPELRDFGNRHVGPDAASREYPYQGNGRRSHHVARLPGQHFTCGGLLLGRNLSVRPHRRSIDSARATAPDPPPSDRGAQGGPTQRP